MSEKSNGVTKVMTKLEILSKRIEFPGRLWPALLWCSCHLLPMQHRMDQDSKKDHGLLFSYQRPDGFCSGYWDACNKDDTDLQPPGQVQGMNAG
jgi:hypothetical protein